MAMGASAAQMRSGRASVSDPVRVVRLLYPLLGRYRWTLPLLIGLGFLQSLAEGLGISLFIPLLQYMGSAGSDEPNDFLRRLNALFASVPQHQRLWVICLCILATVVLKNLVGYANAYLFSLVNWHVNHHLRVAVFSQIMHVGLTYIDRQPAGTFVNTLDKDTWQTSQAFGTLLGLTVSACTITVFAALLLLISWQLTLWVGLALLAISLVIRLMTRRIRALGQAVAQLNAEFVARVVEALSGLRVIRAHSREQQECAEFATASRSLCRDFMRLDLIGATVGPLSEVLSAVLLAGVVVLAFRDGKAIPALLTFVFMLYRLQPRVKSFDSGWVYLRSLAGSLERVQAILRRDDKPYVRSGTLPFVSLREHIVFDSVGFRYGDDADQALRDISLTILRGKTTAIVGPSGAGKSTLLNLLCRFYDPQLGQIRVDGVPLPQLDLASWRQRLAVVSQETHIFNTTVAANIAYGQAQAGERQITEAAKKANAHEFILQLPQGYKTRVGDRGVRLSGGQRQRLVLARAIIRDPQILILDEATNALDSIAESLIQEALLALGRDRTVIVVAHRLSTIKHADQIVVLEEGAVCEYGDFEALTRQAGLFARMYQLQLAPLRGNPKFDVRNPSSERQ